jgi:hypothetical protein
MAKLVVLLLTPRKAFFKLKNIFNNIPCSAPMFMHIFDHTVKPVLLYASEIVGLFNNNKNVGVNSNNEPPAARGHDECFCTAGPSI